MWVAVLRRRSLHRPPSSGASRHLLPQGEKGAVPILDCRGPSLGNLASSLTSDKCRVGWVFRALPTRNAAPPLQFVGLGMRLRAARRFAHLNLSPINRAMRAATPWALGVALLASFTADAGQEVPQGASMAPISSAGAAVMPARLAPDPLSLDAGFDAPFGRGLLRQARLEFGPPEKFDAVPDEDAPRGDLKKGVRVFPEIDRREKGDPLVNLRPSISGRLRRRARCKRLRADILTFDQDESGLASTFASGEGAAGPDSAAHFEAWNAENAPVTEDSLSDASPAAGSADMTMRPAALAERIAQGATPAVPRAEVLRLQHALCRRPDAGRGRYDGRSRKANRLRSAGATISRIFRWNVWKSEKHCLAQAIYFEARSESRGRPGRRRAGHPQPYDLRALSPTDLRGGVPEPAPLPRLPVLLRLRRPGVAGARPRGLGQATASPTTCWAAKPGSPISATSPITTPIMCGRAGRGRSRKST